MQWLCVPNQGRYRQGEAPLLLLSVLRFTEFELTYQFFCLMAWSTCLLSHKSKYCPLLTLHGWSTTMVAFQRELELGPGSQHYAVGIFPGRAICLESCHVQIKHNGVLVFICISFIPSLFFISLAKHSISILKHIEESRHICLLDFSKTALHFSIW